MAELLIIKTTDTNKLKKLKDFIAKNHIAIQIIHDIVLADKKKRAKKDKLREYIEAKSKEDIFSDYGKALKDKELEAEKELLENDLD